MSAIQHPSFGAEPVQYRVDYLPDDAEGQVAATIDMMRRYVKEDYTKPEIQEDAFRAVNGERDSITDRECVERVYRFVNDRITFTEDTALTGLFEHQEPDMPIVEALIRPVDMSVMCSGGSCGRVGDCDDFSMTVAALLLALGIRCSFVTVAADSNNPGVMSHVYVAAYTQDGQRIPVDASHGPRAGWETANATRIQEWPLLSGLGDIAVIGLVAFIAAKYGGYI